MSTFRTGDRVRFLVDFEHAGCYIPVGHIGTVKRDGPSNGFVPVVAKDRLWLCKAHEIAALTVESSDPPK